MTDFKRQDPRKIYLIEAYNNGVSQYKIGVSIDPKKRYKQHRTSNPNLIGIIYEYESNWPFKIETALKNSFSHLSIDGEWYDLSYEDVEHFKDICLKTEQNIELIYNNSTFDF